MIYEVISSKKKKLNKYETELFKDLLKTMEELKDNPNRERFCIDFDKEDACWLDICPQCWAIDREGRK